MGYYTYINASGSIHPALSDADLKPHSADDGNGNGYFDFTQHEGDEDVQIVDGKITVVGKKAGWTEVDFGYEDSVKAYDIEDHVKALIQTCVQNKTKLNLEMTGDGEESGDVWRLVVVDNVTRGTESPLYLWPDGTTSSPR